VRSFMDAGHHLIVLNQYNAPVVVCKHRLPINAIMLITESVKIDFVC
jgi:hypothetical protein